MAFLFTCGFECGHVGLTSPAGGGTKHFTAGNGTPSIVTANMPGAWSARAMRFTASAGNNIWRSRSVTATNGYSVIKGRIKFIGSLPSANCYVLFIDHTGVCSDVRLLFRSSNSKIVCKVEPGAGGDEAEGPVVAADTWYYFEIRARPNNASTNLVVDWKWDGTAQTSISASGRTGSGEQLTRVMWGTNIEGVSSANATVEFDDLLLGDATGDYDGVKYEVKGYLAASDGTHSFDASDGTDFKKGTIGSLANAASSDTNLWESLDELAGDNTTALSADGPEAGEYTATQFAQESSRTAAPVFAEIVTTNRVSTGTAASKQSARAYDGTSTTDLYTDISVNTTTPQILGYGLAAAPSGAWTIALLNALVLRWGGSWSGTPDTNPTPYLTSALIEVAHPPAALAATVNQVTETDSVQALTSHKAKAIGQTSETDSPQTVSAVRTYALGQPAETDSVFALTSKKTTTLAQTSEANSAQPLFREQVVPVAQTSEADTAQAVTARKTAALGQASEADSAFAASSHKVRAIGQTEEIDLAQALAATRKTFAIAQAIETDFAQTVTSTGSKVIAVTMVSETDSALTVTVNPIRRLIGIATETDGVFALTAMKRGAIGLALEGDVTQAVTVLRRYQLGFASESDAAQAMGLIRGYALGIASETDSAQAIGKSKLSAIAQALELDSALAVTWVSGTMIIFGPLVRMMTRPRITGVQPSVAITARQSVPRSSPVTPDE